MEAVTLIRQPYTTLRVGIFERYVSQAKIEVWSMQEWLGRTLCCETEPRVMSKIFRFDDIVLRVI